MLTPKQRAHLTSLAHHKKPVVLLGQRGLTDAIVKETDFALLAHELIKVKMRGADDLESDAETLAERCGAEVVAIRGSIVMLYRAHPDEPRLALPRG
ncbi:MAG: YhbY family RNA-binding protein [Myxococcota bacterium]